MCTLPDQIKQDLRKNLAQYFVFRGRLRNLRILYWKSFRHRILDRQLGQYEECFSFVWEFIMLLLNRPEVQQGCKGPVTVHMHDSTMEIPYPPSSFINLLKLHYKLNCFSRLPLENSCHEHRLCMHSSATLFVHQLDLVCLLLEPEFIHLVPRVLIYRRGSFTSSRS